MRQLYGGELQQRHLVGENSAIGAARRDSQRLAMSLMLDETMVGSVGVVVTELATNLLRHAGGGELLLQAIPTPAGNSLEVLAIDRGPGMDNVEKCLRDGYSSAGSAGTGLGAVRRLSAEFDIHSVRGHGTAVMARVGGHTHRACGAVCRAKDGETECGDAWRLAAEDDQYCALLVVDGLGHGSSAAVAADSATRAFSREPRDAPHLQIEHAHQALVGTRGAAVACAAFNRGGDALAYAGIGNVSGRLIGAGGDHGLVSHNGTLGVHMRRVQEFRYPAVAGDLLIMHSDGLSTHWDLDDHDGLRYRHPAVIAATLYRDHTRGRDDATVVVVPL